MLCVRCPGVPSVLPESLLLHPLLGEHAGPLLPTPHRFVPRGVLDHSLLPRVLQRDITSKQLHRECPLQMLWVLPFGSEPRGKRKGWCLPSSPHRAHRHHPGPGENLQGDRWLSGHVEASVYLFPDRRKGRHSTYFPPLEIHQPTGAACEHKAFPRPRIPVPPGLGRGVGQSELRCPGGLLEANL